MWNSAAPVLQSIAVALWKSVEVNFSSMAGQWVGIAGGRASRRVGKVRRGSMQPYGLVLYTRSLALQTYSLKAVARLGRWYKVLTNLGWRITGDIGRAEFAVNVHEPSCAHQSVSMDRPSDVSSSRNAMTSSTLLSLEA